MRPYVFGPAAVPDVARMTPDARASDAVTRPPQWVVPLSDIVVDDEIREAVRDTLDSGWWSMGPRVQEFERAFAELCGCEHAFAVANGTAALHLALLACGCGPGDEVVLPSLNFVAAANTIRYVGATPIFCDLLGEDDLNLDPADVAAAVGPATKALLVLHYGGVACDMEAVLDLADRQGLLVIEDAAHAPGATWRGRRLGSVGLVGCFSFFSNKNLPMGEGGMVVTNDAATAERIRLLRSHGMTTLTWDRHRGHASLYDVVEPGLNYRLDEIRAAVGLVQLRRLEERNAARGRIAAEYRRRLDGVHGLRMPFASADPAASSHHLAVVLLPPGTERQRVQSALRDVGIQTSVHYPPIHRFSAYADAGAARPLPNTELVADRILTLPLFAHMRAEQVDAVTEALVRALESTP
jgi:dTDP-4-amino-4,6-dideoxygalactose transaminase